jgi:hypothetical protein
MATKKAGKKLGLKKSAAKKSGAKKRDAVNRKSPESLIGATVRWGFTEGPAKGSIYEHTFNADGSVEYRNVTEGKAKSKATREKLCGVEKITPGVHVISYLSSSGYTLTVVLNFEDMSAHSYASNEKGWFPAKGTFEVINQS